MLQVPDLFQTGGCARAGRVNCGKVASGCIWHQAHLPACQVGSQMQMHAVFVTCFALVCCQNGAIMPVCV